MAAKVDIAGTDLSARQAYEFDRLAASPGSHVNRVTFQAYIERRDPFTFERNAHGHIILTLTGLDLTGEQEIERLTNAGHHVSDYAKSCLLSCATDGYDNNHHLVAGREYRIALAPGKEIEKDTDRTTANLQQLGTKYGYGKPLGGLIPRIRESVSDKQIEEMGIWYIVGLHDPINDSDDDPNVLDVNRYGGGPWVNAYWGRPDDLWHAYGAFAFPVSAS